MSATLRPSPGSTGDGRPAAPAQDGHAGVVESMFILGHSHVGCLCEAAVEHDVKLNAFALWLFGRPVIYGDGAARLDPELEAKLRSTVVSTIGGSAHDMIGLAQHPRPFDFVLPEAPDLPLTPGAEILSYRAVVETVGAAIDDEQFDLLRLLPARGRKAMHLESPPPYFDNARLAVDLGMMPFVPKPSPGPSDPWLRYKLWRVHSAIFRRACEECGIAFVPVPAQSLDDGGFLKADLYSHPCHVNAKYGALVLRQLGVLA